MSIYTHCIFVDLLFLSLMLSKILKDPDNSDAILVPWLVFFIVSVVVQSHQYLAHDMDVFILCGRSESSPLVSRFDC